ncbi:MAG: adaptor protein MecA [Oscillospiraceae bacterium]|nr:adaptor protein MecA [Oscillospiraceae bacterium]
MTVIKRISHHALSIYLNAADLRELDITYEALDYLCPHTRRIIQQLLETALAQTGFDPEGQRLYIEAYPMEEDGCLLLFTLIDEGKDKEERAESAEPTLFLFSSFAGLRQACGLLDPALPSALYWREGRYLLALWLTNSQRSAVTEQLNPYGVPAADNELLLAELTEHNCCLLKERAAALIDQYFS